MKTHLIMSRVETDDEIVAKFDIGIITGEPLVHLEIGDISVYLDTPERLVEIVEQCRSVASRLNVAQVADWNDRHPEHATALLDGGQCEGCQRTVPRLFTTTVTTGVDGNDRETLNACPSCAGIPADDALELANAVRLTEDESPNDLRADLHDAGLDDNPHGYHLDDEGTVHYATAPGTAVAS
jgi:hypothetical protein